MYFVSLLSNAISGESALDRLACGLGGKTMLPHIIANIPQMLVNSKSDLVRWSLSACTQVSLRNKFHQRQVWKSYVDHQTDFTFWKLMILSCYVLGNNSDIKLSLKS